MQPRNISRESRIDSRCTCSCHEINNDILCCGAGSGCCGGAGHLRYDSEIQVEIHKRHLAIFGDEDASVKKVLGVGK